MNQLYCVGCNSSGGHRKDMWFVYEWYSKKTIERYYYKRDALARSRELNTQAKLQKESILENEKT